MVRAAPSKQDEPMNDRLRITAEEGVVFLQLADVAEKNALAAGLVGELEAALGTVGSDQRAKVLVLCGLSDVFCSGGHKDMLKQLASGIVAPTDIMLTRALLEVPIPTISAMEGHAVGGGLLLGLACDMVIMARESRFGCSFMNMGFTPGMGTTRLLAAAVGEHFAAEMMFGGRFFKGTDFEGRGLNYVVPRANVMTRARSLGARIAEKPRHALVLLKRSLSLRRRLDFEEARTTETFMHELCFGHPETSALIEDNYPMAQNGETANDGKTTK